MTIQVGETLADSGKRLASIPGAVIIVAFLAFRFWQSAVYETVLVQAIEWVLEWYGGYSMDRLAQEAAERGYYTVDQLVRSLQEAGLDIPFPVAIAFLVALPFMAEFLHVVGVRALAADWADGVPTDEILPGLGMAYAKSQIANFLALVMIVLGTLFFLLPGLLFAAFFFFVRQRIVLDDDGIFASIQESYALARENLLQVIALGVVLLVVGMISTWLPGTVGQVARALVIVWGISLATSAYLDATGEDASIMA